MILNYATQDQVNEINSNLLELETKVDGLITKVTITNLQIEFATLINSYIPSGKKPFAFIRTGGTMNTGTILIWYNHANGNWHLVCRQWADSALITSGTLDGIMLCI